MKELLSNIKKVSLKDSSGLILLDTCFIINILKHHKHLDRLKDKKISITSFNVEELLYVEHRLNNELKKMIRTFLKYPQFSILEIPVHPGYPKSERNFVDSVDPNILKKVHDPSDAVLIAAAIITHSTVLTKDKHHIFTVELEDFLKEYRIEVYKDLNFLR